MAQINYGLFLGKLGADLFHIPLNAVPLMMPKPYLVTIHDMSTLLFASQSGYRNRLRHFYLRRGLLRADRVMTVSMATCRDVETLLGIPASRIRVIYNAPDPIFRCPQQRAGSMARRRLIRRDAKSPGSLSYPLSVPVVCRTHQSAKKHSPAGGGLRGAAWRDPGSPGYRDLRLMIIGDEISRYPGAASRRDPEPR